MTKRHHFEKLWVVHHPKQGFGIFEHPDTDEPGLLVFHARELADGFLANYAKHYPRQGRKWSVREIDSETLPRLVFAHNPDGDYIVKVSDVTFLGLQMAPLAA